MVNSNSKKRIRKKKKWRRRSGILRKSLFVLVASLFITTGIHLYLIEFDAAEKDFLFLSKILKEQTKGVEDTIERLTIMTDWLHENVKHGKYPPGFNGKGVANVIRSGVGNCGFQSCNIACFAELLGLKEHRIVHNRKEWGAPGLHTFAEIQVDDEWIIFDPDKWQYIENTEGELVGLEEVVSDTSRIQNDEAAQWLHATFENKGYKFTSSWQKTPLPFGENAYTKYEAFGMLYIYKNKLSGKWNTIFLISLALAGLSAVIFSFYPEKKLKESKKR